MEKDPYRILKISKDADLSEIKRAYRRLVRRLHPDVCGRNMQNLRRFLEIKDAYALLTKGATGIGTSHVSSSAEGVNADCSPREKDLRDGAFVFHKVDPIKCLLGSEITVSISDREDFCPDCMGLGRAGLKTADSCPDCSGAGFRLLAWAGEDMKIICTTCNGTGSKQVWPCKRCGGSGKVIRQREVSFRIPRGAVDGTVIELKGQGPWDPVEKRRTTLFVEIEVGLPEGMEIRGRDILSKFQVDCWTCLQGGSVTLQTINGPKEVFIHPEIAEKGRLVLKGLGWVDGKGNRGDHVFLVEISYPSGHCPREAQKHLEALKRIWPVPSEKIKAIE